MSKRNLKTVRVHNFPGDGDLRWRGVDFKVVGTTPEGKVTRWRGICTGSVINLEEALQGYVCQMSSHIRGCGETPEKALENLRTRISEEVAELQQFLIDTIDTE